MSERPILFSSAMVRALLSGAKTQTRRVVKPQPAPYVDFVREHAPEVYGQGALCAFRADGKTHQRMAPCPYGQPGDRMYVKETWQYYDWSEYGEPTIRYAADNGTLSPEVPEEWCGRTQDVWAELSSAENYAIDNRARDRKWRPSIHMPRWASRITLEITGIRVERLQDISEADALAEGSREPSLADITGARWTEVGVYAALWESINGPGSWEANPWVWVIEFRRLP